MTINDFVKGTAFIKLCRNDFKRNKKFDQIAKYFEKLAESKIAHVLYINVSALGECCDPIIISRADFKYGDLLDDYLQFLKLPEHIDEFKVDTYGVFSE